MAIDNATVVDPVFWHKVLGLDNAVYKTASTYAYELPELKTHLEQQRAVHNGEFQEERRALMQDHLHSTTIHHKITEHLSWKEAESDLQASCVFLDLAYVPPHPFERPTPIKWRWPTREQARNETSKWLRRWNAWAFKDTQRRNRLQQSIDSVTQRMRQEKLREQWFLLGARERDLIAQSKKDTLTLNALKLEASKPRRSYVVDESKGFVSASTGSVEFGPDEEYKTRGEAVLALREGGF